MSRNAFRKMRGWMIFILLGSVAGVAAYAAKTSWDLQKSHAYLDIPRIPVGRTDLHVTLVAGGEVDSAQKTLIECELESLSLMSEGRTLTTRGSSQIIELTPEGTQVKEGDVLCRLDASEIEELIRQQEIKVLQARSEYERATFELEAAEMAVIEYKNGLLSQQTQQIESQRQLAQAEIQRAADRLAWSERMVKQGYIASGQLLADQLQVTRSEINLKRLDSQISTLKRFEAPAAINRLEMRVNTAKTNLHFQDVRLKRRLEQMENFQKQADNCTIRAPHDGVLLYANEDDDDARIELGTTVYRKMDMFYLPDFNNMEVVTVLNETKVSQVEKGMPALIRIESLSKRELEGDVVAVDPLPITPKNWREQNDVRNFRARIKIHNVPEGLKPGMSARVEIVTAQHPNSLVIPATSVAIDDGQSFCFLPSPNGLIRRSVEVEAATPDLLRVTSGLSEGEEVIVDTSLIADTIPIIEEPAIPIRTDRSTPQLTGIVVGQKTAHAH